MPVTLSEWRARIGAFVRRTEDDNVLAIKSLQKHMRSLFKLLVKTYTHNPTSSKRPSNGQGDNTNGNSTGCGKNDKGIMFRFFFYQ